MKPRLKLKPKAPQSRFPKRRSPLYREFIKQHDCVVKTHARTPSPCYAEPGRYKIECAHYHTKGSGGFDRGNTFPACPGHHTEQEGKDAEFEKKYGLELSVICAELLVEFTGEEEA